MLLRNHRAVCPEAHPVSQNFSFQLYCYKVLESQETSQFQHLHAVLNAAGVACPPYCPLHKKGREHVRSNASVYTLQLELRLELRRLKRTG